MIGTNASPTPALLEADPSRARRAVPVLGPSDPRPADARRERPGDLLRWRERLRQVDVARGRRGGGGAALDRQQPGGSGRYARPCSSARVSASARVDAEIAQGLLPPGRGL